MSYSWMWPQKIAAKPHSFRWFDAIAYSIWTNSMGFLLSILVNLNVMCVFFRSSKRFHNSLNEKYVWNGDYYISNTYQYTRYGGLFYIVKQAEPNIWMGLSRIGRLTSLGFNSLLATSWVELINYNNLNNKQTWCI